MDPKEIIAKLKELADRFDGQVSSASTEQEIRDMQATFIGKKGELTQLQKLMGKSDP